MRIPSLITLVVLMSTTLSAFAEDTLPIAQQFSRGAEFSNLKISPAGDYIGAITKHEGKNKLLILDAETKQLHHAVFFPGNAQVGNYQWVNNNRLVLQKEYLKGWQEHPIYYGELFAVNADGSKATYLFGYNSGEQQTGSYIKKNTPIRATAHILDPLPNDDRHMLVNAVRWTNSNLVDYELKQDVYRVDVYRGKRKKLMRAPIGYSRFLTDYEGEVRFAVGEDKSNTTKVFYRKDGEWINSDKLTLGLTDFSPISFTEQKDSIYAAGREEGQTVGVYRIDLETGNKKKIIQDKVVDPSNFWINRKTKQLYAVEFENGYPNYAFVNPKEQHSKVLKQLIDALPGHQVHIVSQDRDSNVLIIKASNDRNPGDYYIFDAKKVKLEYLASQKDWLDPDLMAEVKPISFTSRDGILIHGYLTLPHAKEAKNLPLVVNPHGGPYNTRDWWEFNAQNQMIASEGMAVLQVNFRGSGGYGSAFEQAGYQKWGTDIQYDIIDATRYVIEQGYVDKNRICIAGSSFGGYSALQSAIIEPELFKCAIGIAGVYDLPLWKDDSDVADSDSGQSYQDQALGTNIAQLKAMSPAYNVSKLKASLMLVHGGDDKRVPIEQLESLEISLNKIDYPYKKLVMDDEGHNFYNDSHRAKYYSEMLTFLKTNLKL
ncbi:S9 family peptidase [Shewanella sp. KX20019]|uniref:alpha/beta hydrolase family protein n=1 Tax=Shewanella sp. KX20019 TaxID=2803864 RepID=UPI001925DDCD|nr:prolyl oligopeptidase family serine peptidase [Shewanella sp. KX20019]QQX79988.1 S9 family peptidase [Shewanella sp. KX20019]